MGWLCNFLQAVFAGERYLELVLPVYAIGGPSKEHGEHGERGENIWLVYIYTQGGRSDYGTRYHGKKSLNVFVSRECAA